MDDVQLAEAWRQGDRAAGHELFHRHFDGIQRFFRNKFGGQVEDLVQQTFMVLVEGRDRLDAIQHFRGYLFGIAHNVLRQHLRALDRERTFDPMTTSIMALAPGPSTLNAQRSDQALLYRALRMLPLEQQIAIELMYWEDFNARQVGEIIGVPHGTVRSRLRLARTRLLQIMVELEASPALRECSLADLDERVDWESQELDPVP